MEHTDRLHALDAVRACALLLGVVLHAAAAFLQDFPIPMWQDEPSATAAVIYYVIHMFRMSAFFLMAGFFARMVVERRGVKAFVKDRGKRVAVPLFLFGPVAMIAIVFGFVLGSLAHGTGELAALQQQPPAEQEGGGGVNLAHLWFLWYLLIFYAIGLLVRAVVRAIDPRMSLAAACDPAVALVMRGVWAPVLIAAPIVAWLSLHDTWNEWIGLPAPTALVPDTTALIGYGVPFALGWLLHRQVPVLLGVQRYWLFYFATAAVLTVVCVSIVGTTPRWQGPNLEGLERIAYTAAYVVGLWCWVFAFVGAAIRFLSDMRPATRYLADASYWIYLMHMATVIFFVALLRPLDWYWGLKFAITILGSMAILLVSYHYLVRFTWVGAILNGRRYARPGRTPPADLASIRG